MDPDNSMILGYNDILGWLTVNEARTLYELATSLPDQRPVIVEIGSFLGQSSVLLGKGLKGKANPTLFCIDPFNGDGDAISSTIYSDIAKNLSLTLKEQFVANLKKNSVDHLVVVMQGYSTDFAPAFTQAIDLLFIDGNHDYYAVLRDYQDWSPRLKHGGRIVFHDVSTDPGSSNHSGPGLVAKQCILEKPDWSDIQLVDSLLIARKVLP